MKKALSEYAYYKGEEFITIGTLDELCKKFNVKRKTMLFYATPTYKKRGLGYKSKKRISVVKLEDNDE